MMATPLPRWLAAALAALALASCVPSTEDLEVSAKIEAPSLTIEPSAFGSKDDPQGTPKGGFTLSLTLGQLASSGSDVTVQSFAIVSADTQKFLLPLQVQVTAQKSFRVEVAQTQKFDYVLTYDKPVPLKDLCAAGSILFTGTILDGARGKTTPVTGIPILPKGCP